MTGIQALERVAPTLPTRPGKVERREFEYRRHGTLTLIAAFDVASGTVTGRLGETRTAEDFAAFLDGLLASAPPDAPWDVVCDNLNTHKSEAVVAQRGGVDEALGENGKSGVLESMDSRQTFLTDARHRIRFHFTPKHASS